MEKKILILTDDNGYLCMSLTTKNKNNSADVKMICQEFENLGWTVLCRKYSDINTKDLKSYHNGYVLYASSEDCGLFYKDYIEDILFMLKRQGNILLPELEYFKTHHNKMFMELTRDNFVNEAFKTIQTMYFSSDAELKKYMSENNIQYPVVVKAAAGSGSSGVGLAKNAKELMSLGKKYSRRIYFDHYANLYRTQLMQKIKNVYRKVKGANEVNYRNKKGKFIVQTFIKNLSGDYKVLVFGKKFYVLERKNRDKDFRASGSGMFTFPDLSKDLIKILDFAEALKREINQPLLSLDIASDGEKCHLIEFQCLSFGPYTLQMSESYFVKEEETWKKVEGKSILEKEIARAVNEFVMK